ncbi:unnamed protein product, partial [Discosporangium mesarthrocarpum]
GYGIQVRESVWGCLRLACVQVGCKRAPHLYTGHGARRISGAGDGVHLVFRGWPLDVRCGCGCCIRTCFCLLALSVLTPPKRNSTELPVLLVTWLCLDIFLTSFFL